jgi:hypothetical protein
MPCFPLVQDQSIEIEFGLQHVLRGHDVDPPGELLGLQARFGLVRCRCLDEFDRLLGEFRDRRRSLVAIGIDDSSAFRDRIAEFLDDVRVFLGPVARCLLQDFVTRLIIDIFDDHIFFMKTQGR